MAKAHPPRSTTLLPAGKVGVAAAVERLEGGGLVAFPTETVYGLGADARNPEAVARIYAAKGRPRFNPLIAHVVDMEAATRLGFFGRRARALASAFWPGPLTIVVPAEAKSPVCDLARAGLESVAIRVPSHKVALEVLKAFGAPVAAPSANRSGHVSPTTAAHVLADLGAEVDLVLDGGACDVGVESTIVACLGGPARLLRPGGISRAAIEAVLGEPLQGPMLHEANAGDGEADAPLAPGMLSSHYAPNAQVRLDVREVKKGEALLAFGAPRPDGADKAAHVLDLSPTGDLVEAAAHLYAHLRALDATGVGTIAVAPIPAEGLGEAIRDRLARASAKR